MAPPNYKEYDRVEKVYQWNLNLVNIDIHSKEILHTPLDVLNML